MELIDTRPSKLSQANSHFVVSPQRLGVISAHQTVPPWKIETKIAVSLVLQNRMMNSVHIRCDYDPSQESVHSQGNLNIPMIEHRRRIENHLK